MIVLDENIVEGQRLLLEGWNVTARHVAALVVCAGKPSKLRTPAPLAEIDNRTQPSLSLRPW